MKKPTPFGKYFLLERINVGGMAEVFRAKAFGVEGFERLVAVKRILPNIAEDTAFIEMFVEEAKLAVQLNHANIAQIFDLGKVDQSYYIALEHVHGRDLRGIFDRCRQLGEAMPVAQACFMIMKVCEGLDYAHNKRDQMGRELALVHRDVSPQNVLISFEGEVKIIDFGIAKAAGKGSKTQAGILKGKFGYMSPEQVRGLPVDRRSDVFSCGIVLYELLTGERLFVGESDFSTLEKVRNVEILPPSTYNRRIPDELERIVLKALSKDVEDRYQNAIDLHDELQAFVYTAGEFYSRKDLAGWMKKTFGREIEEETAKLESYRQLKPPPPPVEAQTPPLTRTLAGTKTPPPARRTGASAAIQPAGKPPPVPGAVPVRTTGQNAAVAAAPAAAPARKPRGDDDSGQLAWDDDELETQIYDNPEDDPKLKQQRTSKPMPVAAAAGPAAAPLVPPPSAPLPGHAPTMRAAAAHAPTAPVVATGPDLSSLASATSKGWESAAVSPASTLNGMGTGAVNGSAKLATGSNNAVAPTLAPAPGLPAPGQPLGPDSAPFAFDSAAGDLPSRRARSNNMFDPMAASTFGSAISARKDGKRGVLFIALGGAVVAAVVVVAIIATSGGDKNKSAPAPAPADRVATVPPAGPADQNTGFDLYVSPAGVTQWKLDGEARTDRLPSRIRGITPGPHTVQIDPPPGFLSESKQVVVEAGRAERVEIALQAIDITGVFESNPPGATVSLIVNGKREPIGPSPATYKLDPNHSYQVLFEKPGYVSVNRPVAITGVAEERLVVNLEKASAPIPTPPPDVAVRTPPDIAPKPERPKPERPKPDKPDKPEPRIVEKPDKPVVEKPIVEKPEGPRGMGVLTLGSKPPCEIYIDGSATGLHTPQREIKLSAGKHRITLINNEYGIKESFTVDIKPDAPAKMIKDYSDRLPK